ncbi:MAG: caspase family protein [Sedimentibacter saalensis]|uniref:caspase family protein n=1 Tax=Sedimentibacter saalensis TaxID=130788 RepID=UPI0031597619
MEKNVVRYAVIVGINNYSGSCISNLNFCANDAEAFYDALIQYSKYDAENIQLFSDGKHPKANPITYTDILSAIKGMCNKATDQDSILFYFAGHGTRDENDSYLLTKEFRSNVISDSSISMKKVNDYFTSSLAKFKLRFFDACHSGRFGVRGLSNPGVATDLAVEAEGWATLASCKEEQYAHELSDIGHGVFSYFLVKGLSGEASINDINVSLDNLKVYVMDQTINFTRKLGIEQTPVFSGEQAGTLILSLIDKEYTNKLPDNLVRIKETDTQDLEPISSDTDVLITSLANLLTNDIYKTDFISKDQDNKIGLINTLTDHVEGWAIKCKDAIEKKLPSEHQFAIVRAEVSSVPLNLEVAEYLNKTNKRDVIEFNFEYDKETRYKKGHYTETEEPKNLLKPAIFGQSSRITRTYERDFPYEVDVLEGISQDRNYPASSVVITFEPGSHIFPKCCMVVIFIPSNFGIYSLCYFGASELNKGMIETWNASTFLTRFFFAIPIDGDWSNFLNSNLNQTFAEFISFIEENSKVRKINFEKLGAYETNN